MGICSFKNEINNLIDQGETDQIVMFLQDHPDLINSEINLDNHHTPLTRSIWKQNYALTRILLGDFKAEPNFFNGRYSPLMSATMKDNIELI